MEQFITKQRLWDEYAVQGTNKLLTLSGLTHSYSFSANTVSVITTPSTGDASDSVIVWDSVDRQLKVVTQSSIAAQYPSGGNDTEVQFNVSGTTSGLTSFYFNYTDEGLTLGTRSGTTGQYSLVVGDSNEASDFYTTAFGSQTIASGAYAHAQGGETLASAIYSHAEGFATSATTSAAHSEGGETIASGQYSHAQNEFTHSNGRASHSGGQGTSTLKIYSNGLASFNHSFNDTGQTSGHGALAPYSAILGGKNHNIEVGNTGATIIGGDTIKLTGVTYANTTAVDNLAIMSEPTSGSSNQVLIRNTATGVIEYRDGSGLGGGSGSETLSGLTDTNVTGATDGSMLYYSTGSSAWLDTKNDLIWDGSSLFFVASASTTDTFTDSLSIILRGTGNVGGTPHTSNWRLRAEPDSTNNILSKFVIAQDTDGGGFTDRLKIDESGRVIINGTAGNRGFYFREAKDQGIASHNDEIFFIPNGSVSWKMYDPAGSVDLFYGAVAGAPAMYNRAGGANTPQYLTHASFATTGLGGTSNSVSLIVSSVEGLTVTSTADIVIPNGDLILSGTTTGVTDSDQILTLNPSTSVVEYRAASSLAGEHAFSGHTDVNTTGATDGSMLYYSTGDSAWLDSNTGLTYSPSIGLSVSQGNLNIGTSLITEIDPAARIRILSFWDIHSQYLRSAVSYGPQLSRQASLGIGFSFNAESGTGMGRIAANTLGLYTGNQSAIVIDSNQAVTITGSTYLTGTTYLSLPTSGSSDQVLVRDVSTGEVKYRSAESLGLEHNHDSLYWKVTGTTNVTNPTISGDTIFDGNVTGTSLTITGQQSTGLNFGGTDYGIRKTGAGQMRIYAGNATDLGYVMRFDSSSFSTGQATGSFQLNFSPSLSNLPYSFVTDLNTGLYRNSADNFSLVTGGVIGLTVDSGQTVIIQNGDLVLSGTTSGTSDDVLVRNPSTGVVEYRPATDLAGEHAFSGHTDVNVSGATDGSMLYYSGGTWLDSNNDLTWNGTKVKIDTVDGSSFLIEDGSNRPMAELGVVVGANQGFLQLQRGDTIVTRLDGTITENYIAPSANLRLSGNAQLRLQTGGVDAIIIDTNQNSTVNGNLTVTGNTNITGNTTIGGTISASNLSGTNTGDNALGSAGQIPFMNGGGTDFSYTALLEYNSNILEVHSTTNNARYISIGYAAQATIQTEDPDDLILGANSVGVITIDGDNTPLSSLLITNGTLNIVQTPATGTVSDNILLRDGTGNVDQIAFGSVNLSAFNDDVLSGSYLPLSGGTLTGDLTINADLYVTGQTYFTGDTNVSDGYLLQVQGTPNSNLELTSTDVRLQAQQDVELRAGTTSRVIRHQHGTTVTYAEVNNTNNFTYQFLPPPYVGATTGQTIDINVDVSGQTGTPDHKVIDINLLYGTGRTATEEVKFVNFTRDGNNLHWINSLGHFAYRQYDVDGTVDRLFASNGDDMWFSRNSPPNSIRFYVGAGGTETTIPTEGIYFEWEPAGNDGFIGHTSNGTMLRFDNSPNQIRVLSDLVLSGTTTSGSSDLILIKNETTGVLEYRNASTLGGEHNLGDHIDVTDTGKTDGSMLYYSTGTSEWLDSGELLTWDTNELRVKATPRTTDGITNSPVITQRASTYGSSTEHQIEWRTIVAPVDTGATQYDWILQRQVDGGGWGTRLTVDEIGRIFAEQSINFTGGNRGIISNLSTIGVVLNQTYGGVNNSIGVIAANPTLGTVYLNGVSHGVTLPEITAPTTLDTSGFGRLYADSSDSDLYWRDGSGNTHNLSIDSFSGSSDVNTTGATDGSMLYYSTGSSSWLDSGTGLTWNPTGGGTGLTIQDGYNINLGTTAGPNGGRIYFGDGDTYIGEYISDDRIDFRLGGDADTVTFAGVGNSIARFGSTQYSPQIRFGNQTSAPSYRWDTDTNSGLGRTAEDNIALYTSGVTALTIDEDRFVAIPRGLGINGATATDAIPLDVSLATDDSETIRLGALRIRSLSTNDRGIDGTTNSGFLKITSNESSSEETVLILYGKQHATDAASFRLGNVVGDVEGDNPAGDSLIYGANASGQATTEANAHGGDIDMRAGNATTGAVSASGGTINIFGGAGNNNANGGNLYLDGGIAGTGGTAGNVYVANTRGNVIIGNASTGDLVLSATTSGSTSDDILVRDSSTGIVQYRNASTLGGEHNLGDHIDVVDTGKTNGSMLYYVTGSSQWLDTGGDVTWDGTTFSIDGALEATTKSFAIEHPTKEGKKLIYGSLEGPEHGVYHRGRVKGSDRIELPEYWDALVNRGTVTAHLTPVGSYQKLYIRGMGKNCVYIGIEDGSIEDIHATFTVYGEREHIETER